jgi:hypothetical protein
MKHLKYWKELHENQNYQIVSFTRNNFDHIQNNRVATFIDRLLSKSFYESNNKRHDYWSDDIISRLNPETADYLLQLYGMIEDQGLIRLTPYRDEFGKLPQTPHEKIKALSGNHWGGFGRFAGADREISSLPVPTPDVIDNLMEIMAPKDKEDLLSLYQKLFQTV